MEENKEGTQQAAQEAYVRQLAELSARVLHMTEEQKQRNAAKIEELNKRVAALPSALRGLYAQKLRSLAPEAPVPQAAPVQQPPAADAAYEPEYADGYEDEEEDEDEVPARRRKKRKKHGCLIVMLVFLLLAALATGLLALMGSCPLDAPALILCGLSVFSSGLLVSHMQPAETDTY